MAPGARLTRCYFFFAAVFFAAGFAAFLVVAFLAAGFLAVAMLLTSFLLEFATSDAAIIFIIRAGCQKKRYKKVFV